MSRFDDYTTQVRAGAPLVWRHDLISETGEVLASTDADQADLVWGASIRPLAHQMARVSSKSSVLSLPVTDDRLMPDKVGDLLHPDTGNRVRSWAGVQDSAGDPIWWIQSTMLPNQVQGDVQEGVATITAPLVDTLRPVRTQMADTFTFDAGETVEAVVQRVLDQVVDGATVAPTGFVTPRGSVKKGTDRIRFITELLEGCGHEITTTPLGEVVTRKILSSADDGGPKWVYGPDGLPASDSRRVIDPRVPQAWLIEGGSFQNNDDPIELVVYDTDPTSEGYYDGRTDARIETRRFQWITTRPQAGEAGYGLLRRSGVGPMKVRFVSVPNPALRENDLVDFTEPLLKVEGTFRVTGFIIPQQVDGPMMVEARKVYDPQVNYRPPVDNVDGCVLSFNDSFGREDQNLEHLPPASPGSPDYVEHGWSFNIRNGECVQLNQAWCLALRSAPCCSADHYSQITISRIPSGKFLGPAIGSSGGFECYGAVVDSAGNLRVEKWQNGRKVHQYASVNIGTPAGKNVYIQRVGSTITAGVGANTVEIVDTTLSGTWFGFIGTGGWGSDASALSNFNGGEA